MGPDAPSTASPEPDAAPVEEPPLDDGGVGDEYSDAWDEAETAESGAAPASDPSETTDDPPESAPAPGAEASGDEPPATAPEGGEPSPSEPDAGDIWANASPELKSAFEAEKRRADAAEHGKQSAEGRHAATQRRLDAVMAGELEGGDPEGAPTRRSRQTLTPEAVQEAQKKWQAFKDEYPEVAEPFEPLLAMLEGRIVATEEENRRLRAGMEDVGQRGLVAASDAAEQDVRQAHPDFDDIANSEALADWYDKQPAFVQAAFDENAEHITDSATVVKILNDFKRDTGFQGKSNGSEAAPENGNGQRQPADPLDRARLRTSTGQPRPTRGARVPETQAPHSGSFDQEWDRADAEERRAAAG